LVSPPNSEAGHQLPIELHGHPDGLQLGVLIGDVRVDGDPRPHMDRRSSQLVVEPHIGSPQLLRHPWRPPQEALEEIVDDAH